VAREPSQAWSVDLVVGRTLPDSVELTRRGRAAVVTLDVRLEPLDGLTGARLRTRTMWSRYWPWMVNIAVVSGGIVALAALVSGTRVREFGLDVLVPLFSGVFTIIVIFTPAFWWMVARHAPPQSRWLIAYTRALLRAVPS
jgi:hypothetical protein